MSSISIVHLGSYHKTCEANVNLIDVFKEDVKGKDPKMTFNYVRKIAIEAPPETELVVNDIDIIMPSTGIFELGLDYIHINNLVFKSSVDVNIIYMY